jgi:hypothetical protein
VTLVVDQIAAVRRIGLAAPRPEPLATIAAV